MDFNEMIAKLLAGHKTTRVGWENEKTHLVLEGDMIRIKKEGKTHDWLISKDDLIAQDWSII